MGQAQAKQHLRTHEQSGFPTTYKSIPDQRPFSIKETNIHTEHKPDQNSPNTLMEKVNPSARALHQEENHDA